ncbi:MAG: hypothetical protein L6U99_11365 [Clostridium sp.]|nr:MAG: hypothetical protein L6U99_11365 [Clostridium sp.]
MYATRNNYWLYCFFISFFISCLFLGIIVSAIVIVIANKEIKKSRR